MSARKAVLLMAYGTPDTLHQVGEYFAHIRGGRQPSAEAIANLRARYERIGGTTPLLRVTRELASRLEASLAAAGQPARVYVGMKHWHPYIADTMRAMRDDGVRDVTAIVLAPHFSRLSVGAYRHEVEETQRTLGEPFDIHFVERWHMVPEFLEMMETLVRDGLAHFPSESREQVAVVFTAHSLPIRIREWSDPYENELLESSRAVAERLALPDWRFAWQSAGGTTEPWIGPDILDYLDTLHAEGVREVLQVPIGFLSEHLEVLYDIDVEATGKAESLGMTLRRTELPNAGAALVRALGAVVQSAASEAIALEVSAHVPSS